MQLQGNGVGGGTNVAEPGGMVSIKLIGMTPVALVADVFVIVKVNEQSPPGLQVAEFAFFSILILSI